jgi:predicted ATP-grasp superfamily ATP-dependent carboligase
VTPPPAILVGANMVTAMSVIRSLGGAGIDVRLLCRKGAAPTYSRYARRLPADGPGPAGDAWLDYLLGPGSTGLRGAVLLACNDDGIQFLLDHRDTLAADYVLDVCEPAAQRAMLDKLATYRAAAGAGVPTPRFWAAESEEQLRAHQDEYVFPLMVKPLLAHAFKKVFSGKYFIVHDLEELLATFRRSQAEQIDVVLLEVIPGPDDLLCSYYTYLDEAGDPLFHFTKRVIRRYPEREGFGCYHITDWNPEVRDVGLRLFQHVGLRGVANVEFKRDPRDGRLKLIECNARFTAANGLLVASGIDLGLFVYRRLAGLPQPALGDVRYTTGLRLWYPLDDFLAFLELRRQGRMTLGTWLKDVCHRQVLPYFSLSDPMPSLVRLKNMSRRLVAEGVHNVSRRWSDHGA